MFCHHKLSESHVSGWSEISPSISLMIPDNVLSWGLFFKVSTLLVVEAFLTRLAKRVEERGKYKFPFLDPLPKFCFPYDIIFPICIYECK